VSYLLKFNKVQDHNLDLAPTSTKLIMGDGRTIRPIVSTVLRQVALSQDFQPFFTWNTSSHYSIIAKFEEVRCIPKVFSTFGDYPPLRVSI
jgi:hypothetical protein